MVKDKTVISLEHYPIRSKEEDLIAEWKPRMIVALSALDELLFKNFGGEKVIGMMKSLGMKEDELIDHPMVSKSIANTQKKLEIKVGSERLADSPQEWFMKNHPAS